MNVFSLVRENPEIIVNFPSQSSATVGQLPVKSPSSVLFFTTPHLLFGSVSVQTMRMKVSSFEVMNLQNVVCQQGASILWWGVALLQLSSLKRIPDDNSHINRGMLSGMYRQDATSPRTASNPSAVLPVRSFQHSHAK
jgi:hypothetical protein